MLDPWIIEEITRREERERRDDRPALEIPLPLPEPPDQAVQEEDEVQRGVVIVDLSS